MWLPSSKLSCLLCSQSSRPRCARPKRSSTRREPTRSGLPGRPRRESYRSRRMDGGTPHRRALRLRPAGSVSPRRNGSDFARLPRKKRLASTPGLHEGRRPWSPASSRSFWMTRSSCDDARVDRRQRSGSLVEQSTGGTGRQPQDRPIDAGRSGGVAGSFPLRARRGRVDGGAPGCRRGGRDNGVASAGAGRLADRRGGRDGPAVVRRFRDRERGGAPRAAFRW